MQTSEYHEYLKMKSRFREEQKRKEVSDDV